MTSTIQVPSGHSGVGRMGNGKDTRTRCVGGIPTFQKGIANSNSDLPEFVLVDVEACNGVVHIINEVLLDNSFL